MTNNILMAIILRTKDLIVFFIFIASLLIK